MKLKETKSKIKSIETESKIENEEDIPVVLKKGKILKKS
jgi:hypothetical protein